MVPEYVRRSPRVDLADQSRRWPLLNLADSDSPLSRVWLPTVAPMLASCRWRLKNKPRKTCWVIRGVGCTMKRQSYGWTLMLPARWDM